MNLTSFLADPAWQGIAGILGLVAVIATILVARRPRKNIAYWVSSNEPIIGVNDRLLGELELTYNGQKVNGARLAVVQVVNRGNAAILPEDFHSALTVNLKGPAAKLYAVQVTDESPDNLSVQADARGASVDIRPTLLNAGDGFALKIVAADFTEIDVTARVADMPEVQRWKAAKRFYIMNVAVAFFLTGLGALAVIALLRAAGLNLAYTAGWALAVIGCLLSALDTLLEMVAAAVWPRQRRVGNRRIS